MKRFLAVICAVLLLGTSAALAANSTKPTIGITDFETVGENPNARNMSNMVSEWLTTYIVQSFRLNVVERQKLARVLEELALNQTGIINPEEAKKIGELSGAQALLMGSIFITAIIALPLWNWVSKKLDKRKAYALGISFWALAQLLLITLNASSSTVFVLVLCVVAGIGVSAAHVLPWAMIPDAIEYGELNTGERHEGVFYSLVTLMAKVASSIAIPLTAFVLEFTGYIPNSLSQPESALIGIRFLMGPIPALFLIIGIVFALRYPLERKEFNAIVDKLEIQRAAKKQGSVSED